MKFRILVLNALLLLTSKVSAFAPVQSNTRGCKSGIDQNIRFETASYVPSSRLSPTELQATILGGNDLVNLLLEKSIDSGVPALFSIIVVAIAAKLFSNARSGNKRPPMGANSAVSELYDDLYGGFQKPPSPPFPLPFGPPPAPKARPANLGLPASQFIKVKNMNEKFDSYEYNMVAATESKAQAAAKLRSKNFDRALEKATFGSTELHPSEKAELLKVEKKFLGDGSQIMGSIVQAETQLTDMAIREEMTKLGVNIDDLDVPLNATKANSTEVSSSDKENKKEVEKLRKTLEETLAKSQKSLLQHELTFVQNVTQILGAQRANAFRAATLGDISTRGAGQILRQLQDRPLSVMLGEEDTRKKSIFVTRFPGDTTASQVSKLREEVTAIIRSAKKGDEALMVLISGGGTVTGYGLAAGQLMRFKEAGIKLTICVEQVAASGGYMMCCTADRIVASPLAVLGSIGVITEIPNAYERLTKEGFEFATITAGKYKRTVTPTKKITDEDIEKQKEDVEQILKLFKNFVHNNRPSLDIENVATGETWFGKDALEKGLCDEIKTVDSVLMDYIDSGYNVYDIEYAEPQQDPLKNALSLVPGSENSSSDDNMLRRVTRWGIQTVISEIKNEISANTITPIQQQYMATDDTRDRMRLE